ncbi:MAG: hypothetical protein KDD63_25565, partial [Bacteroidetes bacterium]|nr:hypothetical protein [Bacteroidota bacterium]
TASWGKFWSEYIRKKGKELGKKVAITEMWDPWNLGHITHRETFDHPELYDFVEISQNNHQRGQNHWDNGLAQIQRLKASGNLRPVTNVKTYGSDQGQHGGGTQNGIQSFIRSVFFGSAAVRFHRPTSGLGLGTEAQAVIRSMRDLANQMDFFDAIPGNELLTNREENEAYCRYIGRKTYAVYFTNGGEVGLNLESAHGKADVLWLEVMTSKWQKGGEINGGNIAQIKAPGEGHWILLLNFETSEEVIPQLDNPVTLSYLKQHLQKNSPRLVLNKNIEKKLKQKVKTDPVVSNLYKAIQLNAGKIQTEPLLVRKMTGRRLLHVSREMLYRMNMLGMVYRMEKDKTVLKRINEELLAVCQFSDWNPSHFLDVAEMSLAVAMGLDWTGGDLPLQTVQIAEKALIEKALLPGFPEGDEHWWAKGDNNWNQVCHGGLIAAAIVVAEKEPELAVKTIRRALEYMPYALKEYGPDGVYPEGSTYWEYGTSFSVITAAMFESAFGTDFGMAEFPAFKESAVFRWLANAPSGMYYNFADCGDRRGPNGDM